MREENRVLIYTNGLLPYSETFIRDHGSSLSRYRPYYVGCRRVDGIELEGKEVVVNDGSALGLLRELRFKVSGRAPAFVQRLRALKPSLLHAHFGGSAAVALPIAEALGLPFVVNFHGVDASRTLRDRLQHPTLTSHLYLQRAKRLQRRADVFLVVAEYMKDVLIAQGYPEHKIRVHYLGIDTRFFSPQREALPAPIVLYVGRLVEKKGAEYLIRAMARVQQRVPEAELIVIGDGPLRASLEQAAAEQLRKHRFLGRRPPEEVRAWMNRARVFSVPSIVAGSGDREGLSIVILEAQAVGTPVVTFPTGGSPEGIAHGTTGFLVPEKDEEALAEHLTKLLLNDAMWSSFSEQATAWVRGRFDIRAQAGKLELLYDELTQADRVAGRVRPGAPRASAISVPR